MGEVRIGQDMTAFTLSGSGDIPFLLTTWPRYFTSLMKRWHFLGERFSFAVLSLSKTFCRLVSSWEKDCPGTGYRQGTQVLWTCRGRPASTSSISRSKVAGPLQSPNGMTLNCHSPWPVEKAVFSLELSSSWTCQYPLLRSRVENHSTPDNASMVSSIRGRDMSPCECL